MNLEEDDLRAVRWVLEGHVSLARVAREYSMRRSAAVAVTLLIASDRTVFRKRGDFGRSMRLLVVESGVPVGGWPEDQEWPEWYSTKRVYGDVVGYSKKLGLHKNEAGVVYINPDGTLHDLLKNKAYRRHARNLYATVFRPLFRRAQKRG